MNKNIKLLFSAALILITAVSCANDKSSSSSNADTKSSLVDESSVSITDEATTESATKSELVKNIQPAEGTYVYDYAALLSSEEFSECNDYAEWMYETLLINTAVVTTNSLDNLSPEEYAENAYLQIYEGKGSGLLILINNETNEDIIYKKGSCLSFITEENEKNTLYSATQKIVVEDDYKNAILELMALGEACPSYIFDNGAVFNNEDIPSLEELCSGSSVSVLATSNSTEQTNEELALEYYKRHYGTENGSLIFLDKVSNTFTVIVNGQAYTQNADAIASANEKAALSDYVGATKALIKILK